MRRMSKRLAPVGLTGFCGNGGSPAHTKEGPGAPPAPGQGPDQVLQQLGAEAAPVGTEEALAAAWGHWGQLFAPQPPRPRRLRPEKAPTDMPTIQRTRGQGQRLSLEQAALVDKLRSMLTPYK